MQGKGTLGFETDTLLNTLILIQFLYSYSKISPV